MGYYHSMKEKLFIYFKIGQKNELLVYVSFETMSFKTI